MQAERDTSSGLQQQVLELQQSSDKVRQQLKQAAEANRNLTAQLETARAASKTAIKVSLALHVGNSQVVLQLYLFCLC